MRRRSGQGARVAHGRMNTSNQQELLLLLPTPSLFSTTAYMDRTVVHDWLRSILTPYADPQRTFADVTSLLDGYPSLSPRTDLYISNVGQSSLLLQLYGTLPIQYRNATYNIPVQIWVTRAYPREPPIAFVTPTSTMLVRKTEDVELDGEVQTEYAKQWARKWEVSGRGQGHASRGGID